MSVSILLVDDEPSFREELMEALEFEGFIVDAVGSVRKAVEVCEENAFDLIITDLKMSTACGLDLLRALQKLETPPLAFVLSGYDPESIRREVTRLGAAHCFSKPINPDVLVEHISMHLPS